METKWTDRELELLGGTVLLQGLDPSKVRRGVEDPRCSRERFEKGKEIYSPRRFRRSLGVLLTGRIQVSKGELVVSTLSPGELFGAAALFHQRADYENTLTARQSCEVAFLPQEWVAEQVNAFPEVCANYIGYLSDRIHFLNEKIEGLTTPGTVGKLCRHLLSDEGRAPCSATELARRLDVSRASLYRAFDELESTGAIRRKGKLVEVLDAIKLKQITESD